MCKTDLIQCRKCNKKQKGEFFKLNYTNIGNFPKTKLQWLWENMKGSRGIYIAGMLGTIVYNVLQLTVPYYSGKIVDLFLSGADARENLRTNSNLFYHLLICMVGFTVLRGVIVYVDCMVYEHVSQTVLYRVRNFLYDKIQRQLIVIVVFLLVLLCPTTVPFVFPVIFPPYMLNVPPPVWPISTLTPFSVPP